MEFLVSANCPLCDSRDAGPAFEKNGYSLFECGQCESIFVYPRPSSEEIKAFYRRQGEETMSSVCWSDTLDSHRHSWATWERLLQIAEELTGKGPLLDLGCGTGQFLDFARSKGWEPRIGIELSPEIAGRARVLTKGTILVADLARIPLRRNYFAAIVLWDIIEHVPQVRDLLIAVHGLLRAGGVLLMGTVHWKGISFRLKKERALSVSPPEHLTFLTRKGLARALRDSGLELSSCWSNTVFLREWAHFLPGARNVSSKPATYAAFRTNLTRSRAFRVATTSANRILEATGLGDELAAVAVRCPP